MTKFILFIVIDITIRSALLAPSVDDLVVNLPDGKIQGTVFLTPHNKTYFGFQGIPFATPPVGDLRFEAPLPPQPWDGIRDATKEANSCFTSTKSDNESEDCLYINVYTPSLKPAEQLPVMFWIYGGKFVFGNSFKSLYGPDFIIEEDVILVSFNYRVGVFGFLSTGDSVISGNAGLKDQRLALQWTHDNIIHFGGDPEKITIFGESAGGASVGLQIVGKGTRGLYRAAIPESGNTIVSFSVDENPRDYLDLLATTLSLDSYLNDTLTLKKLLQDIAGHDLNDVAAQLSSQGIPGQKASQPWPVIEPESEHAFLTESPYGLLESGQFNQVPIIIGVTANEAILLLGDLEAIKETGRTYDSEPTSLIPENLHPNSSYNEVIIKTIKNIYLKDGETFENNLRATTQYFADNLFVRAAIKEVELASKYVPVYLYQFAYYGRTINPLIINGFREATHAGELPFLFNQPDIPSSNTTLPEDLLTQDRMVKLWTNFAKYLNPTPEPSELLNLTWPVVNSAEFKFLNINNTLEVRSPLRETYLIWEDIYETFGRKPFVTF